MRDMLATMDSLTEKAAAKPHAHLEAEVPLYVFKTFHACISMKPPFIPLTLQKILLPQTQLSEASCSLEACVALVLARSRVQLHAHHVLPRHWPPARSCIPEPRLHPGRPPGARLCALLLDVSTRNGEVAKACVIVCFRWSHKGERLLTCEFRPCPFLVVSCASSRSSTPWAPC